MSGFALQADGTLIGRSQTFYDDLGRVYQTITFGVDPGTGEVGAGLTDNNWYDPSAHTIKELPSGSNAFTKSVFDGAGRQTTVYYGYDLGSGESNYSSASDVSDDTIVEQTETAYDAASNVIQTTSRQRFHNATGTGPLSYPGGSQPDARVSYVASYPDAVGREQAVADYGTNGAMALVRPSTVPARADTVLVPRPN